MNPSCDWTVLIGSVITSIFRGIAEKLTQTFSASTQSDTINEVLVYGAGDDEKKEQVGLNNLLCIYYVLVHASQSIDVCMPSLDSETISKCLVNVHEKKNTRVRIALHKKLDSNLKPYLDCGLEVKVISTGAVRLEHEFMLIDATGGCEEALAIIGSLDYEVKRVNCNSDSTMLTSEKAVVITLKREFERIWNSVAETE